MQIERFDASKYIPHVCLSAPLLTNALSTYQQFLLSLRCHVAHVAKPVWSKLQHALNLCRRRNLRMQTVREVKAGGQANAMLAIVTALCQFFFCDLELENTASRDKYSSWRAGRPCNHI